MTISEISNKYNLSADTLRYYERIGLLPGVNRNSNGIRNYNEEDCRWIEFVKCMRNAGLPIGVTIEYIKLCQQGDSTFEERKNLLIKQRRQLTKKIEEMQKTLDHLNCKIKGYEQIEKPCNTST